MKWTKEITDEVVKMYRNGYKLKDISEKTGISITAIKSKMERMRSKGEKLERWWK